MGKYLGILFFLIFLDYKILEIFWLRGMNGKKFYGIRDPWFVRNHRVALRRSGRENTKTRGIFHFQDREDPKTKEYSHFQGLNNFLRTWNICHTQRIPEQRNNSYKILE